MKNKEISYLFKYNHTTREYEIHLLLLENKHYVAVTKSNIFLKNKIS